MSSFYDGREVWFLTGSQDLYGEDALRQVADQSRAVVDALNASGAMPAPVVWKPVLKGSDSVKRAMLEAPTATRRCSALSHGCIPSAPRRCGSGAWRR